MNVDGALTLTGMSLQLLAAIAGFMGSSASEGVQTTLVAWSERAKKARPFDIGAWIFVPLVVGISILLIYLDLFPDSPYIPQGGPGLPKPPRWVGWITYGTISGTFITIVISFAAEKSAAWLISILPGSKLEVGVLLARFGLLFSLGVILQIIAVATP